MSTLFFSIMQNKMATPGEQEPLRCPYNNHQITFNYLKSTVETISKTYTPNINHN